MTTPSPDQGCIRLAQAVYSNWGVGEVAGVERGFRIGLGTWDALSPAALAELTGWLQFIPQAETDHKQVFAALRDGRPLWARMFPLPCMDDLGRRAVRYWAHALVAAEVPNGYRRQTPLSWFDSLPFFADLEEAKRAAAGGNELVELRWRPSRSSWTTFTGPDLAGWIRAALHQVGDTAGEAHPIVVSRATARSATVAEPYRVLPPDQWGTLAVDDGFDGVVNAGTRRYWVVGRDLPGDAATADLPAFRAEPRRALHRWLVEMANDGRWSAAIGCVPEVELQEAALRDALPPPAGPVGAEVRTFLLRYGKEIVIDEMEALFKGLAWPAGIIEQVVSGLERLPFDALVDAWRRDRAVVGPLDSADVLGLRGLLNVAFLDQEALGGAARWQQRSIYPLTSAAIAVAVRAGGRRPHLLRRDEPVAGEGFDRCIGALSEDLITSWARWVLRLWPGAPVSLVLPSFDPRDADRWWTRARPALEVCGQWLDRAAQGDKELARSATQWSRYLDGLGYEGSRWAAWFDAQADPEKRQHGRTSKGGSRWRL